MVDPDVVVAKLGELHQRISRIEAHRPPDANALARDADAMDLVSFNLMLSVQVCLDIASHLIADEGWEPVTTLAKHFERLAEHGVLTETTAAAVAEAAGLRNIVAHVYAKADPDKIFLAATDGLDDLRNFAREVSAWLTERQA